MNPPAQDAFRVVPCSSNTAGPAATREPARRWKRILPVFLFLVSTGAALAQGFLYVPNGLGNVEGNSSTVDPFTSSSFRFQQVYASSQFPSGGFISRIAFRIDGGSTNNVQMGFDGSSLVLSTTARGVDSLSPVFAENRGADAVTVRTAGASFGGFPPAPGTTAAFDAIFTFQTPFFYNPAQGNLLVELAGSGGQAFFPGAMDAQFSSGDSVSWVVAQSTFASSGAPSSLGLATRFDIAAVPEPSTWALLVLGGTLALFFRPKR